MYAVSLTFHSPVEILEKWSSYVTETLTVLADNLMEAEKYYLSEVQSDYVEEGKNYNLLILFESEELRNQFFLHELPNITERVEMEFGKEVMIFDTQLTVLSSRG